MIEVGIHNLCKNFGYKKVLDDTNFEVMTGERVAIVGRNGTGKTTLFRIITREETPDKGTVAIRKGATVRMLEQIPTLSATNATTEEVLSEAFAPLRAIEMQLRQLEHEMAMQSESAALEKIMARYARLQDDFAAMGGYDVQETLDRIVQGFGLEELLSTPFNVLSGGQKTIVKLAETMLRAPDILLLDEPTNHLDIKTLAWFEGFLTKYRGTVLIISHDRYFLDRVATKTVLLERGGASVFQGNYSFALREQERMLLLEFEQYKNQQKKISAMKDAIRRFRDWGNQGDNEKFFKKAHMLERRLEKMERLERPQLTKAAIPLHFSGGRSGREVLQIERFSLSFGKTTLFDGADLLVTEKEKICLMGDNGSGKSSLIKAITGENDRFHGRAALGSSVRLGYIPQEIRWEDDRASVLDVFIKEVHCSEGEARKTLARYFFYSDSVYKRVSSLSGGEKVLLKLAMLMQKQVNFLLLDEPTNHIDIETREMLEEALQQYNGTLLFVSHDRYFIRKVANRAVQIEEGRIVPAQIPD